MERRLSIEVTKRGLPALWESGGGMNNTGRATIIAGFKGERLSPIYIRRRGHLACSQHALFAIGIGTIVVEVDHHRKDFAIRVWSVCEVDKETLTVRLTLITEFDKGEWSVPLPEEFQAAVEAAKEKATCWHCREPHYIA